MNDNLKTALDELYNDDSAKFLIGDHVEFSPEFEQKMGKLIKSSKKTPRISIRKHTFKATMIAAAAAALFGISLTAGAAVTRGFTVTEGFNKFWKLPIIKFTAPTDDNSPKTLEKLYTPTVFPEGKNYAYTSSINDKNNVFGATYATTRAEIFEQPFWLDRDIWFTQYTKEAFATTFETPGYVDVSETKVNGCPAYLITEEHYFGYDNTVIWDSDEYIFKLQGNLSVDELIRVAESVAVNEDAIEEVQIPWAEQ